MRHFAVQVKELVSSNLNNMVETASNPAKMLRLLQVEVEENLISLGGELSAAKRREERSQQTAAALDKRTADLTDKTKTAMNHKREDLARAALLAREETQVDADQARSDAASAAKEAQDLQAAISQLETKHAETGARLKEEIANCAAVADTSAKASPASPTPSRSERAIDRIDRLEQRIGFAQAKEDRAPASAQVDAEIEKLEREARIEAELSALKKPAQPARKRKAKAK